MKKFSNFLSSLRTIRLRSLKNTLYFLTIKEWLTVTVLLAIICVSGFSLFNRLNKHFMVAIPALGGSFTEGIVGGPRFINPVLAISDADRDVTTLVFSGLMRRSNNGTVIPDLADSYTVSPDGLTYTFILKDNLRFHDNKKLTASDVVFTVQKIQDPIVKSPKRANWEGVTAIAQDEKTVIFRLKTPFPEFLDNTTVGIIPEHLWKDIPADQMIFSTYNSHPIGTGAYALSSVSQGASGIIDSIKLKSFSKFSLETPYIKNINLNFYSNEDDVIKALRGGTVDQIAGISAENAKKLESSYKVISSPLPRVFALFFNPNKSPLLRDKSITSAIEKAIDKNEIIEQVLYGYGTELSGPLPASLIEDSSIEGSQKIKSENDRILDARTALINGGWRLGDDGIFTKGGSKSVTVTQKKGKKVVKKTITQSTPVNRLQFTITTGDTPELVKTANMIKDILTKVGIQVDTRVYDTGALTSEVIRPREFEILLFGQSVTNPSDLGAFWDSSQRNDPGLNIASYANSQVDSLLSLANKETQDSKRNDIYTKINTVIANDNPAVFLYSPDLIYVTHKDSIYGMNIYSVRNISDRFDTVYKWYKEKDYVWKIFEKYIN